MTLSSVPQPRDPRATQQPAAILRTLDTLTQAVAQLTEQVAELLDQNTKLRELPAVQPKLLTCAEAGKQLSLSEGKVKQLVAVGEIHSVKLGASRRIPAESVDAYIGQLSREAA